MLSISDPPTSSTTWHSLQPSAVLPPSFHELAAVVGVDHVRELAVVLLVAGDDQPPAMVAALDLDADARAGGVPAPGGVFDVGA